MRIRRRLPAGFQLVGRLFAEGQVLRAADAYQRMTDCHERIPPVALESFRK